MIILADAADVAGNRAGPALWIGLGIFAAIVVVASVLANLHSRSDHGRSDNPATPRTPNRASVPAPPDANPAHMVVLTPELAKKVAAAATAADCSVNEWIARAAELRLRHG